MNLLGQIVIGLMSAVAFLVFVAGCAMSLQNEGGDGAAIGGGIVFVGLMLCSILADQNQPQ